MAVVYRAAVLLCLTALAFAHSQARGALAGLTAIQSPRLATTSRRVAYHSNFDLTFDLYDGQQTFKLALEPSHDVLPDGATITHLAADGTVRYQEPLLRSDHKVFKGKALLREADGFWTTVGWARIYMLRDGVRPLFEGAFSVDHNAHHVQLSSNYMKNRNVDDPDLELELDDYMVVWRDSDVGSSLMSRNAAGSSCASDDLWFNNDPSHPVLRNIFRPSEGTYGAVPVAGLFGKRQIDTVPGNGNGAGVNLVSTIGQTQGCPNTRRVALVGVAADCSYMGTFNSTQSARENIITQMNSASNLWEDAFNITLGIQNLTVTDANCPGSAPASTPWNVPCQGGPDISGRLNSFSSWRGTLADTNSHWTLLTNCNSGSAVGLAWLGQSCVHGSQNGNSSGQSETVSGANVVAKTPTEWQVIAHETGHTYGAVHDCTSQTCQNSQFVQSQQCCQLSSQTCDAGEQYIMNPSTVQGITHFSPCTIGNICSAIGRNAVNTTCLSANKGVVTISGQQCGNGIVEAGEDCDCGGEQDCTNDPCCDAKTCKFKGNAVCDDSNDDCCQNCQFAPAGFVCRASTGTCDPQETCTGNTATCPADSKAPDGQSCSIPRNSTTADLGSLQCASGQCTSRDLQCRTVMGAYVQGGNDTYACDQSSCTMSCASPSFGPGTCYGLQQNLLDGTPCGGGGKCQNGQCKGSTTGGEIKSWIDDHKALVIGLGAGIGGLLVLIILTCLISCCCSRGKRTQPVKSVSPVPPMPPAAYYGSPPMSGMRAQPGQDWGYGGGWPPQPPPHQYGDGLRGNGIIESRPDFYAPQARYA